MHVISHKAVILETNSFRFSGRPGLGENVSQRTFISLFFFSHLSMVKCNTAHQGQQIFFSKLLCCSCLLSEWYLNSSQSELKNLWPTNRISQEFCNWSPRGGNNCQTVRTAIIFCCVYPFDLRSYYLMYYHPEWESGTWVGITVTYHALENCWETAISAEFCC